MKILKKLPKKLHFQLNLPLPAFRQVRKKILQRPMSLISRSILFIFLNSGFFITSLVGQEVITGNGSPVINFSDLIMAPNSGWSAAESTKGAVVTIWGLNFGSDRGASYVTVNGTNLTFDVDYPEPWGETGKPVPFLQRISFFLNNSVPSGPGEITVTVNGIKSNPVPFRVDTGNIYFIDVNASGGTGSGSLTDPWQDLSKFIDVMAPGDIGYFREGIYNERYNGGKSNIWVRSSEPSGTAIKPIGFVGYPGERAVFDSNTSGNTSNFTKSIDVDAAYITISKLATDAFGAGIEAKNYARVIGNDFVGTQQFTGGTGIIVSSGDGVKIFGNAIHGARSENRLDHAVYFNGCSTVEGGELAYNYSYDNSFDRGPHFVVNHQVNRCSSNVYLRSHYIYNNVVDCSAYRSRAIGVFDQSWDPGEANEPEPTYVYNNIINKCGDGWHGAMYHNNGHAVFLNNTLINNRGPGLQVSGGLVLSTVAVNNIFVQQGHDEYIDDTQVSIEITEDSNIYYGGDNSTIASNATNKILADPEFSLDVINGLFSLSSSSPVIGMGSSSYSDIVTNDFYSVLRSVELNYDIGAIEYVDSLLSVDDSIFANTISIVPNPTHNIFTIDLDGEVLESVIIYNELGQQVKEITTKEVNISELSKGIYFIKITSQSGKIATKKVVKN